MKVRQSFIGFLFCLTIFVAGMAPVMGYAAFTKGQELSHTLSVCIEKKDAVALLDADAKDGFEAAAKLWVELDGCMNVPVIGPKVGNVVKSAKVKRGDKTSVASVVEIVNAGEVIGYFFTTAPIDRNS